MFNRSRIFLLVALGWAAIALAQDAAPGSSQPANVAGKWQMSWQGRDGARQATLQLQQDGSKLTGTLDGERGSMAVTGTINGSSVSFTTQSSGGRRNFTIAYTGTVDGDKMTGAMQPQGGQGGGRGGRHGGGEQNHSWTATRQTGNPSGPAATRDDQSEDPQPGF